MKKVVAYSQEITVGVMPLSSEVDMVEKKLFPSLSILNAKTQVYQKQ